MKKRELVDLMYRQPRPDRPPSYPPDPGSAGRRLAWAVVGMIAFFAAMYVLHLA
jgi:hypothetical protein